MTVCGAGNRQMQRAGTLNALAELLETAGCFAALEQLHLCELAWCFSPPDADGCGKALGRLFRAAEGRAQLRELCLCTFCVSGAVCDAAIKRAFGFGEGEKGVIFPRGFVRNAGGSFSPARCCQSAEGEEGERAPWRGWGVDFCA